MPFPRPTLATLIARIAGDIQSALAGTNPFLRRLMLSVLGRAQAGAVHGLYGHQQWIANQVMVDTCEADTLARWGNILGKPPLPAVAASGSVSVTGTTGSVVPSGSTLGRSDGATFVSQADATLVGGSASVNVVASTAGAAGDCAAGMTLTFTSPIAGVQASATVGSIGGGADPEPTDAWRTRVLARLQTPPRAGTSSDFVDWAMDVSGVTRAWAYAQELGPGTVTVRFMTDTALDGPFPDAVAVAAVLAHLQQVAPVGCTPYVYAPSADPLAISLHLIPDTTANRAAVLASLADLLAREAVPGGVLLLSHIEEAIGSSVGVTDFVLSAPTANVVAAGGAMTTLGAVTWL